MKPPQLGFGFALEGVAKPRKTPKSRKQIRKESYQRHKQTELAGAKKWKEAHKEELIAYKKAYELAHPEWAKAQKKDYRTRHHSQTTARDKARYVSRKAANLCTQCGKVPPEQGHVYCKPCAATNRAREKDRIAKRGGERAQHLHKTWRLTLAEWEALFTAQGRCCAICGTDKPGNRAWHTDHDHRFGTHDRAGYRGILCHGCNKALGLFRDDTALLERAVAYLRKHRLTIVA